MSPELDEPTKRCLSEVVERLNVAEGLLSGTDPARFDSALSAADAAWAALQPQAETYPAVLSLKARALLVRGNALRGPGSKDGNVAALVSFDEALRPWGLIPVRDAAYLPNHHAKTRMSRGITLLTQGGIAQWTESVQCFDRPIKLREALTADREPFVYYGLAAGWMNRGDALTRLGKEPDLREALRSYDQALRVMANLPLDTNPLFRQRMAVAWLNRGITLEALGTESALLQAIDSFGQTLSTLESATDIPNRDQMMAAAWMNRGNVWLKTGTVKAADAREAARCAVKGIAQLERQYLVCAEIGIKSRHIWCQAIATLVEQSDAAEKDALFSEATDVVDEALEIIRDWHARGFRRFGVLAGELFRFGVRVYQIHQPHFLEEFRRENQPLESEPGFNLVAVTVRGG